jgi:hypothetical protein
MVALGPGVTGVFFLALERALDAAWVHGAPEAGEDALRQLPGPRGGGLLAHALREELHDVGAELVRPPRTRLLGDQGGEAAVGQSGLSVIEGRAGKAKGLRAVTDRLAIDAHPANHLVFHLHQIARVEELTAGKEGVAHRLGTGVEAAPLAERVGLGVARAPWRHILVIPFMPFDGRLSTRFQLILIVHQVLRVRLSGSNASSPSLPFTKALWGPD